MYNFEKIECCPGDAIIIELEFGDYDVECLDELAKEFEKALPKNPVVFVPYGIIKSAKVISSQAKFIQLETPVGYPKFEINPPISPSTTGGNESW